MPNKHKLRNREDWISIVITIIFILGFLVLANIETSITGLTTVEQLTTVEFEVNSLISTKSILEISSGTQQVQLNLSEFTIKLSELQNIQPVFENDSLVAYNITNMTIDLDSYNIEPTDSVTIRFLEIYKEIIRETVTKRITKEEIITEEIISVTEDITPPKTIEPQVIPETPMENITLENLTVTEAKSLEFKIQPEKNITEFRTQAQTITLEVYKATEKVTCNAFTSPEAELNNNDGSFTDVECDAGESFYATWTNITGCQNSDAVTANIIFTSKVRAEDNGMISTGYQQYLSYSIATDTYVYCMTETEPAATTGFSIITTTCDYTSSGLDTVGEVNAMYGHFDNQDTGQKEWFQIDHTNVTITHDCSQPNNAPTVEIHYPKNNTYSLSHSANFTYNVSDSDAGANGIIVNCTLLMQKGDWAPNASNSTAIIEGINQTMNITTMGHEAINWTVQCEDSGGAMANATMGWFNYTVYDAAPTVSEVFPFNNTYGLTHYTNFTYNVSSLDTIDTCTLWLQKSGTIWELNSTSTTITKEVNQTFNLTMDHEAVNWTISCNNTLFNEYENSSIMNFSVLDATPSVNLVWPFNNTYQTSHKSTNFTYNVSSRDSDLTCDLYVNDAWNSTDTTITRGINQTFNLSFASYQNVNWSIGCNNSFDEYVNSTIYNYTLIEILNQAPKIPIANITQIQDTDVSAGTYKILNYTFVACDTEDDINNLKVYANFTGEGNFFDSNITCEGMSWSNTTCKQYNCTMNLWSWYKAGSWNYSMNVTDTLLWGHGNGSTWILGTTTAITIHPSNISWSNLKMNSWNNTAEGDPIIINNTGNANISYGSVNITGYDLKGEKTPGEYIPGYNFTVNLNTAAWKPECYNGTNNGTAILNATSTKIGGSMLPRGNFTQNDGTAQEQLYFCLRHVPPIKLISAQSYSTEKSDQWVIGVS